MDHASRSRTVVLGAVLAVVLVAAGTMAIVSSERAIAQTDQCPAPAESGGPCVVTGFKRGPIDLQTGVGRPTTTIAALPLDPGTYLITAKLYFGNGPHSFNAYPVTAWCRLVGRSPGLPTASSDHSKASLHLTINNGVEPHENYQAFQAMSLALTHTFEAPGRAVLKCDLVEDAHLFARGIRISALRLGTLVDRPLRAP